ncbi:tRNA (N(6)-L-threonylcarbamoyladenosine(37)-C(2))-methylthiotransferase MtaB [Myxococcota bacterium]|nr:tRNA (N(6)-L-threonylcarbamoyladenosine(37)-C(2))-methylthiotransferase MtaB [Myxococcota bacterium]
MSRGRYYVATFGCRVNQADSQGIEHALAGSALARTSSHHDADVVVINTCTVTHRSDTDVRKLVNRIKRDNPAAEVVVTGCYAQRDPGALARLPGTSAVVGNSHKPELVSIVDGLLSSRDGSRRAPVVVHTAMEELGVDEQPAVDPIASVVDRTRPFVKIQDGCDATCTYCVIPEVRGAARSAEPQRVVEVVEDLVRQGYFEIVLTGVHLGTYGEAFTPRETLDGLVRRVLAIEGLGRLRMSCIEPMAFPLALADVAVEDPRLARHFHLPLQSGVDRVLKRMGRPYRAADYAEIIAALRAKVPDACLGTDVIVGFPGETDEDLDETCRFVEDVGLDYVHVFSYSDRPGVPSTRLPDKVDPRIIKDRSTALHEVGKRMWTRFLDRQVGRVLSAVTLERDLRAPTVIQALSDTFCPIEVDDPVLEPNREVAVKITRRDGDHLVGVPRAAALA